MSAASAQSVYPSAALAHAVATISVALPGAPATARTRLAAGVAACYASDWSAETQTAIARQATVWLAMACWLQRSIRELQHMDATDLLDLLHAARIAHDRTKPADADQSDEPVVVEAPSPT